MDNGANLQASGGINLGTLSLNGTFMFNGMGLTGSTLRELNMPDGHAPVFTFTVDSKLRIPLERASFYAVGGAAWMRRAVTFPKPVIAQTLDAVEKLRSLNECNFAQKNGAIRRAISDHLAAGGDL